MEPEPRPRGQRGPRFPDYVRGQADGRRSESAGPNGEKMDEASFQRKLAELVAEIGTLPAGKGRNDLERTAEQVQQRHAELRTTVAQLQDSIDYVRISLKYLLFDLEATRRENKALRRMLEDGPDGPPPPPGSEPFDIG